MADGNLACVVRYDIRSIAAAIRITKRSAERRATREAWPFGNVARRGGQTRLYAVTDLPGDVQAALALGAVRVARPERGERAPSVAPTEAAIRSAWSRYERRPDRLKAIAQQRVRALQAVEALHHAGLPLQAARAQVAARLQDEGVAGGSAQSLARWAKTVERAHRSDWLALLLPSYAGRTTTAEIESMAWDIFKADYLRLEAPSAASCYRRLERIAAQRPDWEPLPAVRTFLRRIERALPRQVIILAREGEEALMRTYPSQERDRGVFTALEAVNADGHVWDVAVTFPDGTKGRPVVVGFQDLYSGKIVGWRLGQTESSDLVRLAFADMVETYGVPSAVWLDNGRAFASKYLTGRTANRYRFKVREEDPAGIITALGVTVHWVTPYHGQAKPIERAWRDFCDGIAKHPAFAGAYLGNNVANKPENYGSRTVPWDVFERVINDEIAAHNARDGRRTKVCAGRSFDAAFSESYASAPIRKASSEQLRTLLLAAEAVTASRVDGNVRLAGNRYWTEALAPHAGSKVVLRFDPMELHSSVHAYQLDGTYIGAAECIASVGFADTNASREHARAKTQWKRAAKQQLEAERRMDAASVAAQLPTTAPEDLPEPRVIAPVFRHKGAKTTSDEAMPLAATGTDDDVERANRKIERLMDRIAQQHIAEIGWTPPEDR